MLSCVFAHRNATCIQNLGISFKTQLLYVAVFVTRYLDLFMGQWVSLYNTLMKLFFIGTSCYILFLMRVRFKFVLSFSLLNLSG